MAKCVQCGTEAASKFCPNCGAQVPEAPPVAAAAQAPQYPPQPALPPQYQPPQPPPGYPPQAPPQFQGAYPGYQMPPAKQSSPWKWVAIIGGSLLGLLVLLVVIVLALPDDTVDPVVSTPAATKVTTSVVKAPVFTNQVNETSQAPIGILQTVPTATDKIYAAIEVEVKNGDVLSAQWLYNGKLQSHLDTQLPIQKDFKGWAAFHIDNGGKPWPAGTLTVQISLNGQKVHEKSIPIK